MDKQEYFIQSIKHENYHLKDWIVDCFAITAYPEVPKEGNYPYRLVTLTDGSRLCMIPFNDGWHTEPVTGGVMGEPLFGLKEEIEINGSFGIKNYTDNKPLKTTYGNILRNVIMLVYPFGTKIPFQQPYDIGKVEGIIADRFADSPDDPTKRSESEIYEDEYVKYSEGVGLIRGCSYIFSPSGSKKSMTVDPALVKRRDELLEQHKHELHDPAIIAKIAQELSKLDKEWMKGDDAEGFFIKSKLYDVVRMKMFFMLGTEPSLSTEVPSYPITKSLTEGLTADDLVAANNGLRYGSYARGKLTEFGGTVVKLMVQAFRDAKINAEDCGVKEGMSVRIDKKYINLLEGLYVVGDSSPISKEDLESKVGQELIFRTPLLCKAEHNQFCARCIGSKYARNPRGLSIAAMTIGSIFMGIFMAAMHGKAMQTRRFDVKTSFS